MDILASIVIALIMLASAIIIWLGFPGTFIMTILVFLWGWGSGFETFTLMHAIWILVVTFALEGVEFLLGSITAQAYGATRRSAAMGIMGGILGTIIGAGVFAIFGALIGLLAGSYFGVYWSERMEKREKREAARAALAALMGNMAAKLLKSTAAIVVGVWMIRVILAN